jgi:hypothetical protein
MMRIQRAAGLLPDSLIGRSFVLIALLLIFSVLASFQIYRVHEREPRARELAQQTISVVNLTRAALVSAAPASRRCPPVRCSPWCPNGYARSLVPQRASHSRVMPSRDSG